MENDGSEQSIDQQVVGKHERAFHEGKVPVVDTAKCYVFKLSLYKNFLFVVCTLTLSGTP